MCCWGYSSPGKREKFTHPKQLHCAELKARPSPAKLKPSTEIPLRVWARALGGEDRSCLIDQCHKARPRTSTVPRLVAPNHCQVRKTWHKTYSGETKMDLHM